MRSRSALGQRKFLDRMGTWALVLALALGVMIMAIWVGVMLWN